MNSLAQSLATGIQALGLVLDSAQQTALLHYLDLLGKWNKTYNLTAIHEPERMLTHHLLDSLSVLPYIGPGPVLDVGSGAGLPGIPLAIARPGLTVTLIDASQKKCGFMQQAAIELGLKRIRVVHGRVEDLPPEPAFLQIVSRAFSDLQAFAHLTRHVLMANGEWLAMKGVFPEQEIAQLQGCALKRAIPLHVPGLDAERHLIVMEA